MDTVDCNVDTVDCNVGTVDCNVDTVGGRLRVGLNVRCVSFLVTQQLSCSVETSDKFNTKKVQE